MEQGTFQGTPNLEHWSHNPWGLGPSNISAGETSRPGPVLLLLLQLLLFFYYYLLLLVLSISVIIEIYPNMNQ